MSVALHNHRCVQLPGHIISSGHIDFIKSRYLIDMSSVSTLCWTYHLDTSFLIIFEHFICPGWIPSPYGREGYLWVATLPVEEFPPVFNPTTPDTTRRTYA